jgi:hypothetical protein
MNKQNDLKFDALVVSKIPKCMPVGFNIKMDIPVNRCMAHL